MNYNQEDHDVQGSSPALRSSFAREFYQAGEGMDYQYEEPLMQPQPSYSSLAPEAPPQQQLSNFHQAPPAGMPVSAPPAGMPVGAPPAPAYDINSNQVLRNNSSNQVARNSRNYDKLRGRNVLQNQNNQQNNLNLNNNTSSSYMNPDTSQNISSQANYNYPMSDLSGVGNHQEPPPQFGYQYPQAPHGAPPVDQNQMVFQDRDFAPPEQPNPNQRQIMQQQNLNRIKQELVNEACCSFLIILIVFMFAVNAHDCHNYKFWIMVETGYYIFNLLFVYIYYKHIVKRRRDDFRFQVVNCVLNLVHTGWLLYGNVLYFGGNADCQTQSNGSNAIIWVMLSLIIFGYVTIIKCCTYTSLIICFGPMIYREYRRARRPDGNWVPTSKDILKNVMRSKYKPSENEENTECVICMMEYKPNDVTITLPCDNRHFFHAACIENWLKKNNSCPMCKKPVTMDDIKNQKKQIKSAKKK